jgi:hypothetical protein
LNPRRSIVAGGLCAIVCLAPAAPADEAAVGGARRALEQAADFPWYDAQSDGLRGVPLPPDKPLRRASGWEAKAATANSNSSRGSLQGEAIWRWVQYGVWLILAALLGILLYLWMKAIVGQEARGREAAWDEDEQRRHESDSIEQLPFQVQRPQADLLAEARRHYQGGNYRDAIVYLFSYQLVQLDRFRRIELAKGKTNRQYLHELSSSAGLRRLLTETMLAFEDVFFGHYELDRQRFEACWARLDEFDQLVRQTPLESR